MSEIDLIPGCSHNAESSESVIILQLDSGLNEVNENLEHNINKFVILEEQPEDNIDK